MTQEISSRRRQINYMAFLYALDGQREKSERLRRMTRRRSRSRPRRTTGAPEVVGEAI